MIIFIIYEKTATKKKSVEGRDDIFFYVPTINLNANPIIYVVQIQQQRN